MVKTIDERNLPKMMIIDAISPLYRLLLVIPSVSVIARRPGGPTKQSLQTDCFAPLAMTFTSFRAERGISTHASFRAERGISTHASFRAKRGISTHASFRAKRGISTHASFRAKQIGRAH